MSISDFKSRVTQAAADANRKLRSESLGGKAARNAGWLSLAYGVELVMRLVSSLILTRLLDPTAYGLISTVMVFVTIATMLSDVGIRPIILTDDRGDEKDFLGLVWSLQILRGFGVSILLSLLAGGWYYMQANQLIEASSSYANPLLPSLLLVTGFSTLVRGFSSVNEYRVIRHLETRTSQRVAIGTRILTTFFTISVAFIWPSVWALAIAVVVEQIIRATGMALFVPGPKMSWHWNWPDIKKILHHSRWIALGSTMTVINMAADKVLIGYAFGLAVLGIYSSAFALFYAFMLLVLMVMDGTSVPVMRSLATKPPEERKRSYLRMRLPLDLFCVAGGLGMVVVAPLFFQIAYDPRYHDGGLYLAILGIKLILTPLTIVKDYLTGLRRFKLIWAVSTIQTAYFLSMLALAAWFQSIELAVIAVALERLPEMVLYRLIPGTGIPRDWKRDGLLALIGAGSFVYLLI